MFVYESVEKKLTPPSFTSFYKLSNNVYNTVVNRESKLDPPLVRTASYGLNSLKYDGFILWNGLHITVRNACSKMSLKT